MGRSCMLLFILTARGLDIGQVRYIGQWEGKWAHRAYARLLRECTCTGEMVVVHRGFLRCSIEHEGGPVVTKGRVTEALQCSRFLLSLPGYPCPQILAMGISYQDGHNDSRTPPRRLSLQALGRKGRSHPPTDANADIAVQRA